jgi:hypothetical protein
MRMFYAQKQNSDGCMGKCKECIKGDVLKYRNSNIDKVRSYDRERGKLPHRKAATARYLKKFRSDNPECVAAHNKVARAIKSGKIIRPGRCQQCNTKGKVVGHHHDYKKPLEVAWLCQPCHKQLHRDTF